MLHWAAMHNQINLIPPSLLNVKILLRGTDLFTPILMAASCGSLNQIPSRFLTRHTLFYGLPHFQNMLQSGHIIT